MRTGPVLRIGTALLLTAMAVVAVAAEPSGAADAEPDLALFDPTSGQWHLRYSDGSVDEFHHGNPGDTPLMGDWDCDGTDTVAMYRESAGLMYLRNSNDFGFAEMEYFFGAPGDIPIGGDWDGDGCDTVSIYRPSQGKVYVINFLGTAVAEYSYYFGNPGDRPFAGDFDGDGVDTVGLYRRSTGFVYLTNATGEGSVAAPTHREFFYGIPGDRIVAGDWDDDGDDTVGIYRPGDGKFYLSYENETGVADHEIQWGQGTWLPVAGEFGPPPPTPPNIVYIMLDDADFYDFGFNSVDAVTPNIDALRTNGLALSQFYAGGPICSPTRASVLTGQAPIVFGVNHVWRPTYDLDRGRKGLKGLPSTVRQIAGTLGDLGYATAHYGKWHVGESRPEYRPTALGFDEWFHTVPATAPPGQSAEPTKYRGYQEARTHAGNYVYDSDYVTSDITDRVIDFIERQTQEQDRFFVNLWYNIPHEPLHVPPGFDNTDLNFDLSTGRGKVLAMMYRVDSEIGRIVESLAAGGQLSNTALVITSDNGGQRNALSPERDLREWKGSLADGGIRVPFLAHWPDAITPGSSNDSLMTTADLLPTFADLAGISRADLTAIEEQITGESRSSILTNGAQLAHETVLWQVNKPPVHQPDERLAYSYAIRAGDYKIIKVQDEDRYVLFNIAQDPGETRDLANEMPDVRDDLAREMLGQRLRLSRYYGLPESVDGRQVIAFDPRLDVADGDLTLVVDVEVPANLSTKQVIYKKPGSLQLTISPRGILEFRVTGSDPRGNPVIDVLRSPAALTPGNHEIGISVGGFKADFSQAGLYVDGVLVDSLTEDTHFNIWATVSDATIGDDQIGLSNVRYYVTRFWPDEWSTDRP